MHFIYLLARVYPYWALALTVALFQLFLFFRRRRHSMQFTIAGGGVVLVLGTIAWFIFRGDLHSDDWVRALFGE